MILHFGWNFSLNYYLNSRIFRDNNQSNVISLEDNLLSLGLLEKKCKFVIEEGSKFVEKPSLLARKLEISEDIAKEALEILKSNLKDGEKSKIKIIEKCLRDNPDLDNVEDIALMSDLDAYFVSKYFDSMELSSNQEDMIEKTYNSGCTVSEISKILDISHSKVENYLKTKCICFIGDEGKKALEIIKKILGEVSIYQLRNQIRKNDLELQYELGFSLREKNTEEFDTIQAYFQKFQESKYFLSGKFKLSREDIGFIKKHINFSLKQLSTELKRAVPIIKGYLQQYKPSSDEIDYQRDEQSQGLCFILKKVQNIFDYSTLSYSMYRVVITHSLDDIIENRSEITNKEKKQNLEAILHYTFYYLKCSLPFEDIVGIFHRIFPGTSLTNHDLFHLIFQLSDPVLKGLCIENYSFSNPVPLYYPKVHIPQSGKVEYDICKELWYSLKEYNGLISFGLGRASWNPIGKSYLLDKIFKTDFGSSSPQASKFHFSSIDIQLTRNLFGEVQRGESTDWAYIDCHGYSDLEAIKVICNYLDIAIIHVLYSDFKNNISQLNEELSLFQVSHLYLLIRDSDCTTCKVEVKTEGSRKVSKTYLYIPDLTREDIDKHSVESALKSVGHEILHLSIENRKLIQSNFIEKLMVIICKKDCKELQEINEDKEIIRKIIGIIDDKTRHSKSIDFRFLNFYPIFIDYMSAYHRVAFERDQEEIDKLNAQCGELNEKLKDTKMGDVVVFFNDILNRDNYSLILWKLSHELARYTKRIANEEESKLDKMKEHKNDKYNLEILWREAVLSQRYESRVESDFFEIFSSNFSEYVGRGEAFELIDGDNMRYFNQDIDALLRKFYSNKNNQGNRAPIVVSIFGPQSSGKSTLLNYCFGCKFLTSSGRCTKGIYGSLSKLNRPINKSDNLLILDTEGLDAIERQNMTDTSSIQFDRTMVLFCLAVSHVVIINVKGDLGVEMQNLLQICAYSLNRLKVSKVKAPKIFFVLNQQADPDPDKHIGSINLLLGRLNSESDLKEIEGVKISELIQVSRDNLFVLPPAFNYKPLNDPGKKLYHSNIIKLLPTLPFAQECAKLRLAIVSQLSNSTDEVPLKNMSKWMEMSGVVWDTIIQFQDIVKFKNVEELRCSHKLTEMVNELIEKYISKNREQFDKESNNIDLKIEELKSVSNFNIVLTEMMKNFDEVFGKYQDESLHQFSNYCQNDRLLRRNPHMCDEIKLNLRKLFYIERKQYEDRFKLRIKSVMIQLKQFDLMKKIQNAILNNIEKYIGMEFKELDDEFETIWKDTFGEDDLKNGLFDREECFNDFYSIFKMEWIEMEHKQVIFDLFRGLNFNMDMIIELICSDLLDKFIHPFNWAASEQLIYAATNDFHTPLEDMIPYAEKANYVYLSKESLYQHHFKRKHWYSWKKTKECFEISQWIPTECRSLVQYCSGMFNHPDIIWDTAKWRQILDLTSVLKEPEYLSTKTWQKFIANLSKDVIELLKNYTNYPQTLKIKLLINALDFRIRLLNYEIGYIYARLSNIAIRKLSTLVFTIAFESQFEMKASEERANLAKIIDSKPSIKKDFHEKIRNSKIMRENWETNEMTEIDKKRAKKFALDYVDLLENELKTDEQIKIKSYLKEDVRRELTHQSFLSKANERIRIELSKNPKNEQIDVNSFTVQYVCNRNELFLKMFEDKWKDLEKELYTKVSEEMAFCFEKYKSNIVEVLGNLLYMLENRPRRSTSFKDYDSNIIFEIANLDAARENKKLNPNLIKEIPLNAMMLYFIKYLDPDVTPDMFSKFFKEFQVSNIKVRISDTFKSFCKPTEPVLNKESYQKLTTKMYNSGLIFNLYEYVKQFYSTLIEHFLNLKHDEFKKMVSSLKEEYKSNICGCPLQCPGCGKFCEREIHTKNGKCRIKTGHQISSMGGNIWNIDGTALLFTCDDYNDETQVNVPCGLKNWGQFKNASGNFWDWSLLDDEKHESNQDSRQVMIKIWNKFGIAILNYYSQRDGTNIKYVPYKTYVAVKNTYLLSVNFFICLVIDGTASMSKDIKRARVSVGRLMKYFGLRGISPEFKIVIYRDHCDSQLIEKFPPDNSFTNDHSSVENFLAEVNAVGGGDIPEAVLDGLATAATQCDWKNTLNNQNKIIHIFDSPPHGNFPKYKSHSKQSNKKNCCCCNHGKLCNFNWEKDVWDVMKKFNISYHGINTSLNYPKFEDTMKEKLRGLCGKFQFVGKEEVDEAILKIIVNYKI